MKEFYQDQKIISTTFVFGHKINRTETNMSYIVKTIQGHYQETANKCKFSLIVFGYF